MIGNSPPNPSWPGLGPAIHDKGGSTWSGITFAVVDPRKLQQFRWHS